MVAHRWETKYVIQAKHELIIQEVLHSQDIIWQTCLKSARSDGALAWRPSGTTVCFFSHSFPALVSLCGGSLRVISCLISWPFLSYSSVPLPRCRCFFHADALCAPLLPSASSSFLLLLWRLKISPSNPSDTFLLSGHIYCLCCNKQILYSLLSPDWTKFVALLLLFSTSYHVNTRDSPVNYFLCTFKQKNMWKKLTTCWPNQTVVIYKPVNVKRRRMDPCR